MIATRITAAELRVDDEFWGDTPEVVGTSRFWTVVGPVEESPGGVVVARIQWHDGGVDYRTWDTTTALWVRR